MTGDLGEDPDGDGELIASAGFDDCRAHRRELRAGPR